MIGDLNRQRANKRELKSLLLFFATLAAIYVFFVVPKMEDFSLSAGECDELNHLWQAKYRTDFEFTDWPVEEFDCLSEDSGMARALYFIDTLEIHAPDDATKIDFYEWAKGIKPHFNKRPMIALAGSSLFERNEITINSAILLKNNPVEIAGTLIHELRHLDEGYNSHVACAKNPAKACDARLEENPLSGGAYNYNFLFYHQVREFSNASAFEKKLARQLMQETFDEKFNDTPANARTRYDLD